MNNENNVISTKNNSFINSLVYICMLILFFCGQFAILSFFIPLIIKVCTPSKYKTEEFERNIKQSFNYIITFAIILITFIILSILLLTSFILISVQEGLFILILTTILLLCFILLILLSVILYYLTILIIAIYKTINNEQYKFSLIIKFLK